MKKMKIVFVLVAFILTLSIAVGSSLAWLTDKTDSVTNTFTYGDINIDLTESENLDLKMIPGSNITKDPKVTVKANSEACWLFVKIEKSANFDTFMTYTIAEGWKELDGVDGVYYREVEASETAKEFDVIKDNTVTVKDNVTKDMFTKDGYTAPTLTFTAYAVQSENVDDAATAWGYANPTT
ncbi:MAG: hypothetical protein IJ424_03130 [Oscillospiraceae bacterium]|nr:hypothetical protein [Oscillospiraceae bacterium]